MAIQDGLRFTSISSYERKTKLEIPFFSAGVSAGSPSSADDPLEQSLDLNECLIKHPIATFFVRVEGTSMIGAGIHSGDILIVDKALEAEPNSIVIVEMDGSFMVKRLVREAGRFYIQAEDPDSKRIEMADDMHAMIWGVVSYVIHKTT